MYALFTCSNMSVMFTFSDMSATNKCKSKNKEKYNFVSVAARFDI